MNTLPQWTHMRNELHATSRANDKQVVNATGNHRQQQQQQQQH